MSEAPKRIWAARGLYSSNPDGYWPPRPEYILASEHARIVAETAVAAATVEFQNGCKSAFEETAKVAETNGFYLQDSENIVAAIRAMKHEDSK